MTQKQFFFQGEIHSYGFHIHGVKKFQQFVFKLFIQPKVEIRLLFNECDMNVKQCT